jgi:tetratricopeptide (TPR) repeat protein
MDPTQASSWTVWGYALHARAVCAWSAAPGEAPSVETVRAAEARLRASGVAELVSCADELASLLSASSSSGAVSKEEEGVSHLRSGKWMEAEASFSAAVVAAAADSSVRARLLVRLASVQYHTKQYRAALESVDAALALDASHAAAHFLRSLVQRRSRAFEETTRELSEARLYFGVSSLVADATREKEAQLQRRREGGGATPLSSGVGFVSRHESLALAELLSFHEALVAVKAKQPAASEALSAVCRATTAPVAAAAYFHLGDVTRRAQQQQQQQPQSNAARRLLAHAIMHDPAQATWWRSYRNATGGDTKV